MSINQDYVDFVFEGKKRGRPTDEAFRVNDVDVSYNLEEGFIKQHAQTFISNASKIQGVVGQYYQRNASKYGTRSPTERIPFTDYDKANLFKAAGIAPEKIQRAINLISKNDIDLRNRVINDPFNVLCSGLIRVYVMNESKFKTPKEPTGWPANIVSLYLTMRFYCNEFNKFFPFNPNPDVMDYTLEQMSEKYTLKQVNSVFEAIKYLADTNIVNMKDRLLRGADSDLVYYQTNLATRVHGFMKIIAEAFYKNSDEDNRTHTDSSSRQDEEGDFYVGNTSNISSVLESAVRKVLVRFYSDSQIDQRLLEAAVNKTKMSKSKMTVIITRIREANDPKLRELLTYILRYYLMKEGKNLDSVRSSDFIKTMTVLYSVSNTKNDTVIAIKQLLDDIITANQKDILQEGNKNMLDRVKNTFYTYMILFTSANIE
jgi:hypothetical protein